ncbi:hypothetical protein EMPS_08101 [Entomortierella parvispora]|uniref:Uncharacterized protein n=1 Tax=Entomortierella parvispora TaxID=205924 RepID=A0A9P3LZ28_9FUNG|nr:hypothetical protein EMPS_08101 [Entomortierella parvispora]
MKFQSLSLLLVASAALAQLQALEAAPIQLDGNNVDVDRRTLIGDETTVNNMVDNSVGKKTYRVDHNGNSETRNGLFVDGGLLDKRFDSDVDTESISQAPARRSLLGDLFGGDSTTISNVNDNSQHAQTMNQHGNRKTQINKVNKKKTIDRRSLLGDLFGGDSTSIENINDNSQHKKAINQHGNVHTSITQIHKASRDGHKEDDDMAPEDFFERRDYLQQETENAASKLNLGRRGLLWGGQSTSISNVNDNSKTTKTYKSYGNKNTRVSKVYQYRESGHRHQPGNFEKRATVEDFGKPQVERRVLLFGGDSMTISNINDNSKNTKTYNSHGNRIAKLKQYHSNDEKRAENPEPSLMRRGLLFGGDSMSISNVNDNSKTTKTYNSHDNKYKKVASTHIKNVRAKRSRSQDDDEGTLVSKRNNQVPVSVTTTMVQFEQDEQEQKKVVLGPRNLVSIQIITQNTNGQNIDNGRIFTVKQQPPSRQQRYKRKSASKAALQRQSKKNNKMHKSAHKKSNKKAAGK